MVSCGWFLEFELELLVFGLDSIGSEEGFVVLVILVGVCFILMRILFLRFLRVGNLK